MEKCIDLLREQGYDLLANWAVFPRNGEFTFFGSVLLLSNIDPVTKHASLENPLKKVESKKCTSYCHLFSQFSKSSFHAKGVTVDTKRTSF